MAFLITGASRGVGAGIVELLLERGDSVIGCARSTVDRDHPNYTHIQADVSNEDDVKRLFKNIRSEKADIDTVVNCAGVAQQQLAIATPAAQVSDILKANVLGTFLVSKYAIKTMMRSGFGRIISLSSINVKLNSKGSTAYNASKAAIESLMDGLSSEVKGMDITFNALGLSIVADSGMENDLSEDAYKDKMANLRKPGAMTCDEILHAIDFLRSPSASKISGQTIYFGAP